MKRRTDMWRAAAVGRGTLQRGRGVCGVLLIAGAGVAAAQPGTCPLPPVPLSEQVASLQPILLASQGAPIDALVLAIGPDDGSGRLFIVERTGKVRIFRNGVLLPTPFMDLSPGLLTTSARGLLGFVFHRDFAVQGAAGEGGVYTWHTEVVGPSADFPAPGAVHQGVLTEWRVSPSNPNTVDPGSRRELFRADHLSTNHSGGGMAFDSKGYFYLTIGAASSAGLRAQDNTHPDGTVLRIDPLDPSLTPLSLDPVSDNGRYRVAADNPLVGLPGVDEIFAWGLRHPWRICIDPVNDQAFVGDVGQGSYEEVNALVRGGNYGWPYREGHCEGIEPMPVPAPALLEPLASYDRDEGRATIGGYIYRGTNLPALQGKFLFADLTNGSGSFFAAPGRLFVLDVYDSNGALLPPGTAEMKELRIGPVHQGLPLAPTSLGIGGDGELFLVGVETPNAGAAVYELVPPLDMTWNTIDGGGGVVSGGGFALGGTIGQPDAGVLDDGAGLVMQSGLWGGVALSAPQPCYPDCDQSTGVGELDIFDFLCFQNLYDAGDPYACECDSSSGPGVCDIFDFLCFQNAYAAGCP